MTYHRGHKLNKISTKVAIVIGAACIFAISVAGWAYFRNSAQIPKTIQKQLNFTPYIIKKDQIDSTPVSVKYDGKLQLLTYNIFVYQTKIVVSQQSTPQSFVDIPQAYDTLLQKLQAHDSFDSINGKVNITYPVQLHGGQTAVMNDKGVLLFAKPDKNLSLDDWKKLFNGIILD